MIALMTPERSLYEQRRDELADIFGQARQPNGTYDFRRVPMFRHMHSRRALVKLVQAMNEELNTLYDEMVLAEQTHSSANPVQRPRDIQEAWRMIDASY